MDFYTTGAGYDGSIDEYSPNSAQPTGSLYVWNWGGARRRGLLKFDLSALPEGAVVTGGTLTLTFWSGVTNTQLYIHRILAANAGWTADATWNFANGSDLRWFGDAGENGGADAGCSVADIDRASALLGSGLVPVQSETAVVFDLDADELQALVDNNNGIVIRRTDGNAWVVQAFSGEDPRPAYRPKLTLAVAVAPDAPTLLAATAVSQTGIDLAWTCESDPDDWHIERSPDGLADWVEIDTALGSVRTYHDTGLDCGTAYYYRVRGQEHEADLYSEYSNVATDTTYPCTYEAQPHAMLEISWDGTNWTDETSRCLMPDMVSYDYGLLGMGGSMAALGEAPVAQMRCVLANIEGRYSQDRAGSQAATSGGLFQKRIRFNAGYTVPPGIDLATVWEGRIQNAPEDERVATVSLTCYGYDHDVQQQRPEITTLEEKRTDELVEALADEIGYTDTELDRGYTVVPLFYADGDDGLAKMREIAEAEGAVVWVDPQDATLKLWSWAHWIGKATADTWGRADTENARPWRDTANAFDVVNVTYQPRRRGRLMTIHSLTKPIVIPPDTTGYGESVTERLRFRYPLHTLYEYTTRARSAGGENLDAYLSITPAVPQGSMYWEVTLTNTHTRHALVVDKFDVIGWPIEGLSNREYRADRGTLTVARRTDVRPEVRRNEVRARYALQLLAQARLVAELKSYRLQEPPLVLVIGPVPGDPRRHIGDVVSLDLADGISTISTRVVLLHRSGRYGGPEESCRWEETWTAAALDDLYQYPDPSVGEDDGAFVINTSRLSYGRLGY